MKTLHIFCAAVICGAVLSGCVTSRSPDCIGYQSKLDAGKTKKSIAYSYRRSSTASVAKTFDSTSATPATCSAWVVPQDEAGSLRQFCSTFESASMAITPTIDRNGGLCDIMLDIHQQNAWNPLCIFPAMLGGFTLGICPCWGDDVYHLNVVARSKSGLNKEYTVSRTVTTTTWLPFIFAMPFSDTPLSSRDKITLENWKEIRCRMEADGFFDASGAENGQLISAPTETGTQKMLPQPMRTQTEVSVQAVAEKLSVLKDIHAKGLITDEEYSAKKAKIIEGL